MERWYWFIFNSSQKELNMCFFDFSFYVFLEIFGSQNFYELLSNIVQGIKEGPLTE